MRNLALWAAVGFLSVVCTRTAVTQAPAKIEDDVLKEVETDGFLVQQMHHTTESTAKPTALTPSSHNVGNSTSPMEEIEGSADGNDSFATQGGENQTMSIQVISSTTSSLTTGHTITTTQQADGSNSSAVNPDQSLRRGYVLPDTDGSYSGSGDDGILDHNTTVSHRVSPVSSMSDIATARRADVSSTPSNGESGFGPIPNVPAPVKEVSQPRQTHVPNEEPALHKGHVTPDWIIILGFIVGVAALIMLCVAIATRDKWNGPRNVRHPDAQTVSANQPREQEMTTYLLQQGPKVNGKAGEYTVIPLEDLPERC